MQRRGTLGCCFYPVPSYKKYVLWAQSCLLGSVSLRNKVLSVSWVIRMLRWTLTGPIEYAWTIFENVLQGIDIWSAKDI